MVYYILNGCTHSYLMSFRSIMKSICDVISTKPNLHVSLHIRVIKVSADYSETILFYTFWVTLPWEIQEGSKCNPKIGSHVFPRSVGCFEIFNGEWDSMEGEQVTTDVVSKGCKKLIITTVPQSQKQSAASSCKQTTRYNAKTPNMNLQLLAWDTLYHI